MAQLSVGIDVRQFYRPLPRGMGKYICRLLTGLAHFLPEMNFLLYYERSAPHDRPPLPSCFRERRLRFKGSRFELWERIRLPLALFTDAVHLYHGTANTIPRRRPCPMVATLHDTLLLEGEGGVDEHALYVRQEMPGALRGATRIITDSESSARDIERVIDYPREKIRVISLGVDECFTAETSSEDEEILGEYGVTSEDYLFALGALGSRKNTWGLLRALATCKDSFPRTLIVGMQSEGMDCFLKEIEDLGLAKRVTLRSYIPADHLPALYRHALAFVFPSRREGFGLPILEALASATPVLCADRSSMSEIAGDCAVYFDPDDHRSIASALERLLSDEALHHRLVQDGPRQASGFSWLDTSLRTLEVYLEVLSEAGHEVPEIPDRWRVRKSPDSPTVTPR